MFERRGVFAGVEEKEKRGFRSAHKEDGRKPRQENTGALESRSIPKANHKRNMRQAEKGLLPKEVTPLFDVVQGWMLLRPY